MAIMTFTKNVLNNLFHDPATTKYPFVPKEYPERTRGHIENDIDVCILCGMCMRSCPPGAITVDRNAAKWIINRFDCVQCGYCVEKCPKKCLHLVPGYQTPGNKKLAEVMEKPGGVPKPAPKPAAKAGTAAPAAGAAAKPKFTPEEIAAMRAANLAKKAAAAGTAPAAENPAPAAKAEAPAPKAETAAAAPKAETAAPAAGTAKPKFTPEEIAAMRAANIAKRAAAEAAKKGE